ncbi:MAG TPA: hypothetical protein VNA69_23770 [Thermoanaerobaculia bacterium]|nr:hypothetical protein [Thermoanaerobaculia bacterium]
MKAEGRGQKEEMKAEGRRQKAEGRRKQGWVLCLVLTSAFCLLPSAFAASAWTPHPSDGVTMSIYGDDGAIRVDFDFHGHGGYAIARKSVDLDLPPNYQFVFELRGETAPQNLEFQIDRRERRERLVAEPP